MPDNGEQRPAGRPEYKVYRSRRGILSRLRSIDLAGLRERARKEGKDAERERRFGPRRKPLERTRRQWWRWLLYAAGGWILLSFAAFAVSAQLQKWKLDDGAKDALSGNPFLLVDPQTILVIGTDAREAGSQEPGAETRPACLDQGAKGQPPHDGCPGFRSDTLMLVRAGRGTFRKLSIPRDSYAEIPGFAPQKINAAYAFGGAKLAIQTVEQFLGIKVDHVVIVDFQGFEDFIDAIGGVKVDVPKKICADIAGGAGGGQGGITLRIGKGEQTMDGQKALAYARIRKPDPCPGNGPSAFSTGYDDLDRAAAQQAILQGIKGRLTSPLRLPYNFIKGPIIGWTAPKAIVTDMGALTMPQLILASAIGSSGKTDVLCARGGCGPGPLSSIEVGDAERRRAVDKLLNG
jgi:LCP family protein required for cell wall assembly